MSRRNNRQKYEELAMKGYQLLESDIDRLETSLRETPSDLDARFQLLGYYSVKQHDDKVAAKKLATITIWLIDHMPDCGVIDSWGCIDPEIDPASYAESKQHWLAQIETNKDNVRIIGSAAAYFSHQDEELAESLYQQAIALEPYRSEWSRDLAWLLKHAGSERALDALQAMRDAVNKQPEPNRQYYLLDDLAELAFEAGSLDEAAESALRCLSLAFTFGRNWNDGNAVHNANSILGRVALKRGDIEAANKRARKSMRSRLSGFANGFQEVTQF